MDSKHIKWPLEWWRKHEYVFLIVGFLVRKILGIVGSQIETKTILSFASIINLKRCHLQFLNLEIFIFMSKNWPNDARLVAKPLLVW